jgi:hypothetical protein
METASAGETLVPTQLYIVISQKPLLFSDVIAYGVGVASPASPSRLALGLGLLSEEYVRNVKLNIRLRLETRLKIRTCSSVARTGPDSLRSCSSRLLLGLTVCKFANYK